PLAPSCAWYLFPGRSCRPHPNGASDSGANREVSFRKNPRLRTLSEFDPTIGGREPRECAEDGAGRDRGSPGASIHNRGTGGWEVHRLRPLGPHAPGWRRVCPQRGTCTPPGRPLHAGHPDHLSLGVRGKRTGGGDQEHRALTPPVREASDLGGANVIG